MQALKIGLSSLAIAIFASPSVATAEYLVPPGNSAVNQYTESVPTAGGHRDIDKDGNGRKPSPARVLGAANARRLEEQGPHGREAAEVAAATAPSTSVATDSTPPDDSPDEEAGGSGGAGGNGGSGGSKGGGGGEAPVHRASTVEQPPASGEHSAREAPDVSGSSGLGEVLAQATGSSSSGQMGLLFPLTLLGAAAWALAFLWRQRKQPTS